eukprot:TRINITY_DN16768_c0_g1_i1.p1 TRINITY_DN16768_c0_g1~~TRINITY_DN16768_c0_g1_i1.p1  ORF type:complete len:331 (+),score=47.41 TRINITY_DN16768_c0_g1_i1:64-1056(+)
MCIRDSSRDRPSSVMRDIHTGSPTSILKTSFSRRDSASPLAGLRDGNGSPQHHHHTNAQDDEVMRLLSNPSDKRNFLLNRIIVNTYSNGRRIFYTEDDKKEIVDQTVKKLSNITKSQKLQKTITLKTSMSGTSVFFTAPSVATQRMNTDPPKSNTQRTDNSMRDGMQPTFTKEGVKFKDKEVVRKAIEFRVKARRDKDNELLDNLKKERLMNKKQKIEIALGQLDDVLINKEVEAISRGDRRPRELVEAEAGKVQDDYRKVYESAKEKTLIANYDEYFNDRYRGKASVRFDLSMKARQRTREFRDKVGEFISGLSPENARLATEQNHCIS